MRVHGGADWANLLARSVFALLARDRLERDLRVFRLTLVVAVDAQPEHLATLGHVLFAHDGDVVLRLASGDARRATDALVEIDAHAPLVAVVRDWRHPQAEQRIVLDDLLREVRLFLELFERALANQLGQTLLRALLADLADRVDVLRARHPVGNGAVALHADVAGELVAFGSTQRIGVGAHRIDVLGDQAAHVSGRGATVTERDAQRAVGVARRDQRQSRDLTVTDADGDRVGVAHAELLGRARADLDRIVPGQLGHRLRQL